MTQLISVITNDYALLAADRRLTHLTGPRKGEIYDDDTCKLVNLCGVCSITYSGLARIEDHPTHEWIARVLAEANCCHPSTAVEVLSERATIALKRAPLDLKRQVFLVSGWAHFGNPPDFRSHFCAISNILDSSGEWLAQPSDQFTQNLRALPNEEAYRLACFGRPLRQKRKLALERNLRRLALRKIGPKEALRLLVEEIVHTSDVEAANSVGSKILGCCIPKKAALAAFETGHYTMVATLPNETTSSFAYFDPVYSELRQYGPTIVCGEFAATDLETANDPSRDYQRSSHKILHLPKRKT